MFTYLYSQWARRNCNVSVFQYKQGYVLFQQRYEYVLFSSINNNISVFHCKQKYFRFPVQITISPFSSVNSGISVFKQTYVLFFEIIINDIKQQEIVIYDIKTQSFSILETVSNLFDSMATSIHATDLCIVFFFPQCRAFYGIDLMLVWNDRRR